MKNREFEVFLKQPQQHTIYDFFGLPQTATKDEIKKRIDF